MGPWRKQNVILGLDKLEGGVSVSRRLDFQPSTFMIDVEPIRSGMNIPIGMPPPVMVYAKIFFASYLSLLKDTPL